MAATAELDGCGRVARAHVAGIGGDELVAVEVEFACETVGAGGNAACWAWLGLVVFGGMEWTNR